MKLLQRYKYINSLWPMLTHFAHQRVKIWKSIPSKRRSILYSFICQIANHIVQSNLDILELNIKNNLDLWSPGLWLGHTCWINTTLFNFGAKSRWHFAVWIFCSIHVNLWPADCDVHWQILWEPFLFFLLRYSLFFTQ